MTNSSFGQNRTVTQWLRHNNPAANDTISFPIKPIQKSVQLFTSKGDKDSLTTFYWISPTKLVVSEWSDYSETRFFFSFDVFLNDVFKDSLTVVSLNDNQFSQLNNQSNQLRSTNQAEKTDLFGNSNLTKSGSLTRGITVGSNQDASLESGLRLDLSGEIADSVYLIANLTDQSTPIQPDGSTQNLREFDRVYLQVKSPRHQLEMGDIDVNFSASDFAYVNRRLQGAQYQTTDFKGNYKALASIARGVFRTQQIQAQDGFQGPYRLVGNAGEPFIIVIAGTEKVYVDGKLLTRGEDQDYIIDYALGELVFMPRILLNQRSRITVDFQYLNQDFSRTLIAAQAQSNPLWSDKWQIGASFIRETDSDNTLAQLSLGENEIAILEQAGDDPLKAVISGVIPFSSVDGSNRIPYERRDTLINGALKTYFKAINSTSGEVYDVRFSRNQLGLGAYQRAQSGTNGVVYEYVGEGFGQYDTLRSLPRPIDHTMITLRSDLKPTKTLRFKTEFAVSSFDQNKFSSLDDANNDDYAVSQQIEHRSQTDVAKITSTYNYKFSGAKFVYFDRPEEVDFLRKWNLNQFSITEQHIHDVTTDWAFSPHTSYTLDAGVIQRSDMDGKRLKSQFSRDESSKMGFQLRNEWIQSADKVNGTDGVWSNQQMELNYPIKTNRGELKPFLKLSLDERKQAFLTSDSLSNVSYGQYGAGLGVSYVESRDFAVYYEFTLRDDASPINKTLIQDSRNYIHLIKFDFREKTIWNSENAFTYQQREIQKRFENVPGFLSNDAVFIKSNTRYRSLSNAIDAQFFYDVNSQRTALLQETYIEVGPELGQYVWDDLNKDGQRQIDEFFPEQTPNEGTFLKQFLPSDELFPAINLTSRFRLGINPVHFFDKKSDGIAKKIAENVQWSGSVDIRENSTTSKLSDIYLLNLNAFQNDSTTILGRIGLRSELTLFPRNRTHTLRLEVYSMQGKNRQAFGSEDQTSKQYGLNVQSRWSRYTTISNELSWNSDLRLNDALPSRNYQIDAIMYQLSMQVNHSREWQYGLEGSYQNKTENSVQDVRASLIKLGANTRLFWGEKIQASSRVQFRQAKVDGESTALGSFELTEGAGEGANWIWSVQATYQNSTWVQSSLNYDGRTVQNLPTIHTVRFIIRALF